MRRVRQVVDRAELAVYERIIESYAPYVLVRCTRYTNRRRQAQQIGAYTLISTCFMASELGPALPLGRIVDIVAGMVGPDVVSKGAGREWWGSSEELLLVDGRMRQMAQALNALKRPLREVLVLHYVSGLDADDLARLLETPAAQVVAKLRFRGRTPFADGPEADGCAGWFAASPSGISPFSAGARSLGVPGTTASGEPLGGRLSSEAALLPDGPKAPDPPLNRLFSWPCFSPCFTRRLAIESPRGTERPGACPEPASTQEPDEPFFCRIFLVLVRPGLAAGGRDIFL